MKTPKRLQLVAFGEPSDVIELNTVSEPVLGQEDVLVSMEAAPINPSDFLLVRGIYGVRPAFSFWVGAEGTMDRHCAILDCRPVIHRIAREVYADRSPRARGNPIPVFEGYSGCTDRPPPRGARVG